MFTVVYVRFATKEEKSWDASLVLFHWIFKERDEEGEEINFMVIGRLKNSGEANVLGGWSSDDDEFKDYSNLASISLCAHCYPMTLLPNQKKLVTIEIIFLDKL